MARPWLYPNSDADPCEARGRRQRSGDLMRKADKRKPSYHPDRCCNTVAEINRVLWGRRPVGSMPPQGLKK